MVFQNNCSGKSVVSVAVAMVLLCGFGRVTLAAEPVGKIIDSPYEAFEARSIELRRSNSGDVVQIFVEGCPRCAGASILPSGNLIVESGDEPISSSELADFSGLPGVVHIYKPNGMAYRVTFVRVFDAKEIEQ